MSSVTVTIPGTPISKKRPRFARRGKYVTTYNPQETEEGKWIHLFMHGLAKTGLPELIDPLPIIKKGTAISLRCDFIMPVPASSPEKFKVIVENSIVEHIKKPDLDNLIKFVKDCLNSVMWADDSQVTEVMARKFYGNESRTEVMVTWE